MMFLYFFSIIRIDWSKRNYIFYLYIKICLIVMSGNRFISVYGGEVEPNYIPFPNGPPNPLQEGFKMMQNIDRSRVYKF